MDANEQNAMRLGIGSYTYAWAVGVPGYLPERPMTALDLLGRADQLGVGVVQICDNLPLDAMSELQLNEVEQFGQELGVSIEVGTRGIAPETLDRNLELAVRFRSPILRVVIAAEQHHPSPDEVPALLRPILGPLEKAAVCLAIENHDRYSAREFREIIARLDSPQVGICLDTVNSFGALEGPEVVVTTLAADVVNLHVKDFVIHRAGHNLGFVIEGCPAGQGRLNVPWILEQIQESPRRPNAILEQWPAPESTIQATIEKEDRWAQQSIGYLRQLIPN